MQLHPQMPEIQRESVSGEEMSFKQSQAMRSLIRRDVQMNRQNWKNAYDRQWKRAEKAEKQFRDLYRWCLRNQVFPPFFLEMNRCRR